MKLISLALLLFCSIMTSVASAQYLDFEFNNSRFCGLLEDGKVTCTSQVNGFSTSLQPDPNLTFTQIQGGNYYTCGITTEGTVECWGDEPNEGQTSPPSFNSTVISLSVGPYHACAIDDEGSLKCWGQNVHGQTDPPETATDLIDIHAFGIYSTCGVKSTEELICWGQQQTSINSIAPLFTALASTPMTQIRFEFTTGCIIRSDGTAACYQNNTDLEAFAEFSNGPYQEVFPVTDIGNTRSAYAACALNFNNELDCVETVADIVPTLPLAVTRLPDTYKSVHANSRGLFGLSFDDRLVSISNDADNTTNSTLLVIHGEIDMPSLSITDAEYYGSQAGIELFFETPDLRSGTYRRQYDTEIFRDGELLTVTDNYGSYVDRTATTEAQYTYEIRAVHPFGQTGDFSEPVTVSTSRTDPTDPDAPNPPTPSRPNEPTGLRVDVYYHDVELFWDRNNSGAVSYYEIRRDGEPVATTRGTSWYDNSTQGGESYQFDVLAVGSSNEILGIASVQAQIGPAECN